jgi:hypothetical protein
MMVDVLKPELIERLLALETNAAHLSVLADVAAAYAHVAREKADAAQRTLSEVKVFIALLPEGTVLEPRAPMPDADDPAERLGVRLKGAKVPNSAPAPRPNRRQKPPRHPLARLGMMRGHHVPVA